MKWQAMLATVVVCVLIPAALAADGLPRKKLNGADQAAARTASLKLSDVGAKWISRPSGPPGDWKPRCQYVFEPDLSDVIETGEYVSPEFISREGFVALSATEVFQTAAMARTAHIRSAVPGLPICIGTELQNSGGGGAGASVTGRGPIRFRKYGDRLNAYRVNLKIINPDLSTGRLVADFVLVTSKRTEVALFFIGVGQAFPRSFEQVLVQRVVARAI